MKPLVLLLSILLLLGCAAPADPPTTASEMATPTPTATAADTIPILTGELPPYASAEMAGYGAVSELITAALAAVEQTPSYTFYPWQRAEQLVREGQAFAVFPYVVTEERQAEFDFSEPVFISTGKFFYRLSEHPAGIRYDTLEDLQPYRISGVLGYWYEERFAEAGLQVEYVDSDEDSLRALYLGRVDLVPIDELQGWTILEQLYPEEVDDFATVSNPLNQSAAHLMISRTYPQAERLTETFNEGLRTIKENGVYEQILAKYGINAD